MGMVDNGDAADPVVEVPLVEGVAELVPEPVPAPWFNPTKDTPVYLTRAATRTEAKDHKGALSACNRALQKDPNCIAAYTARAAAFAALGQMEASSADLAHAARLQDEADATAAELAPHPVPAPWFSPTKDVEVYLARAVQRMEANDHQGALSACNRSLQKDSNCIAAYKARSAAFAALGQAEAAAADTAHAARLEEEAGTTVTPEVTRSARGVPDQLVGGSLLQAAEEQVEAVQRGAKEREGVLETQLRAALQRAEAAERAVASAKQDVHTGGLAAAAVQQELQATAGAVAAAKAEAAVLGAQLRDAAARAETAEREAKDLRETLGTKVMAAERAAKDSTAAQQQTSGLTQQLREASETSRKAQEEVAALEAKVRKATGREEDLQRTLREQQASSERIVRDAAEREAALEAKVRVKADREDSLVKQVREAAEAAAKAARESEEREATLEAMVRKAAGREEDLQRTLREAQDSLGNAPKDAPEREAALERKVAETFERETALRKEMREAAEAAAKTMREAKDREATLEAKVRALADREADLRTELSSAGEASAAARDRAASDAALEAKVREAQQAADAAARDAREAQDLLRAARDAAAAEAAKAAQREEFLLKEREQALEAKVREAAEREEELLRELRGSQEAEAAAASKAKASDAALQQVVMAVGSGQKPDEKLRQELESQAAQADQLRAQLKEAKDLEAAAWRAEQTLREELAEIGTPSAQSRAGSMPDPELVHQVPSNGDLPQLEKGAERTAPPGDSVQLGTSTPKSVPTGPLSPSRERPTPTLTKQGSAAGSIRMPAHGLIELRMSELSPDGKLGMKVDGVPTGLQVQKINAPNAQTAGFQEGDIIVKVDGVQAPGIPAVRAAAERIRAGKTVVFTVERPPYSSGMSGGSTPRSDQRRVVTAPQVQGPAARAARWQPGAAVYRGF